MRGYAMPPGSGRQWLEGEHVGVSLPLRYRTLDGRVLSFISTPTVFGTAVDVTVQELTLETFSPAGPATGEALRQLARGGPDSQPFGVAAGDGPPGVVAAVPIWCSNARSRL